ncbi:MAG: type II toxin-antitoxin system RelE/ParE family toxin [Spirochaetes bacterium]|nr:MAG: type II toxin-antitoxin system RelE/ParE family toxin [Spirochaetota bacterium]
MELLGGDPRPQGSRKLVDTISSYRIRIGDYRVIYQIDDDARVVTVMHVRHRKDAYT